MKIKIDEEFKNLITPLSSDEHKKLEESILSEGCRDALITWNGYLIDGHNRHGICSKHGLSYNVLEKEFTDKQAVKNWMITNQLGRRNLTPEKFAYMIGKLFEESKKDGFKGNQYAESAIPQSEGKHSTAENIAEEYKIGRATVERNASFSKAIDKISQNLGEDAKEKILNREIDMTRQEVIEISKLEPEEQKEVLEGLERREGKTHRIPSAEKIKEMPHVFYNSGDNEWYTPDEFIEAARRVLGIIELDPASSELADETVRAKTYYTVETNGLEQKWIGKTWMNPPYAGELVSKFCSKLVGHYINGDIPEAIVLVNNATETAWFNTLIDKANAVLFPKSRIRYKNPTGESNSPLQGQAFVYFGNNQDKFIEEFKVFGWGAYICQQ